MASVGRPKKFTNLHIFTSCTERSIYHAFLKVARREGTPISDLLTDFMKDYLKKHGEGNPNFQITKWAGDTSSPMRALPTIGEPITNLQGYSEDDIKELKANLEARIREVKLAHTKTFESIEEAYIRGNSRLSEEAFKSAHGITKEEFYEIRKQRRKVAKQ